LNDFSLSEYLFRLNEKKSLEMIMNICSTQWKCVLPLSEILLV
jgi:hypothetical protein